ncbi:MAG: hypothetical protein R6U28_02070, partial [Cyclonatronaceae bacterium]
MNRPHRSRFLEPLLVLRTVRRKRLLPRPCLCPPTLRLGLHRPPEWPLYRLFRGGYALLTLLLLVFATNGTWTTPAMAGGTAGAISVDADSEKSALTAEDIWNMKRPASGDASPDGRHIVFPVTRYDIEENRSFTNLYLASMDGSSLRQFTSQDADRQPAWSPDGDR